MMGGAGLEPAAAEFADLPFGGHAGECARARAGGARAAPAAAAS